MLSEMDFYQSRSVLLCVPIALAIFFVFQLILDFPQVVLVHDDHKQWRFVAMVAIFLALLCEKPPEKLRGLVKFVRLTGNATQQREWGLHVAKIYQALFMAVGGVAVPYQFFWNRDPQSAWAGLTRAALPLVFSQSVFLIKPSNFKLLLLHRRIMIALVGMFSIATFEQRRAGELPGVQWPGAVLLPLLGAVLHNSVGHCMAECFFLNAVWFDDGAQPDNFLRGLSVCITCLAAVIVCLKVGFIHHMNMTEDMASTLPARGAAQSLSNSCHAVAGDVGLLYEKPHAA